MGLAVKLGLLLLKCQAAEPALTAAALWERVWRRTDDVFLATEDLLDPFKRALELLVEALGGGIELKFGDLKVACAHTPTSALQSCSRSAPTADSLGRILSASTRKGATTTRKTTKTGTTTRSLRRAASSTCCDAEGCAKPEGSCSPSKSCCARDLRRRSTAYP